MTNRIESPQATRFYFAALCYNFVRKVTLPSTERQPLCMA
jgi:hypothetical protein